MREGKATTPRIALIVICVISVWAAALWIVSYLLTASPHHVYCIQMATRSGNHIFGVEQAYLQDGEDMRDGKHGMIFVWANWRDLNPRANVHERAFLIDNTEFRQGWSIDKITSGTNLLMGGIMTNHWPFTEPFELKYGERKSEIPGWKNYCATQDCFTWYFIPPDRTHSDIDKIECAAGPRIPQHAGCTETFRADGFLIYMPIPRAAISHYQEFNNRATALLQKFTAIGSQRCRRG